MAVELNDQGLCLDSTDSTPITPVEGVVNSYCKITVLIEGLTEAWGLFNDPVTNDLFVASWSESGVDALTPVYGLPPVSTQSVPVGFLAPLTLSFCLNFYLNEYRDATFKLSLHNSNPYF